MSLNYKTNSKYFYWSKVPERLNFNGVSTHFRLLSTDAIIAATLYTDLLRTLRSVNIPNIIFLFSRIDFSARECDVATGSHPARALRDALIVFAYAELESRTLTPKEVVMIALGLARLAPNAKIADAGAATAASAWMRIIEKLESGARKTAISAFSPSDVAKIATALTVSGYGSPRAVAALAAHATPSALGAYNYSQMLALTECACITHRAERGMAELAAATSKSYKSPTTTIELDARMALLFATAEEFSLRLVIAGAPRINGVPVEEPAWGEKESSFSDLRGLEDVGNPVLRAALARSRATRPRFSTMQTHERVDSISATYAVSFLHWFSLIGLCPPQLFGGVTRFLAETDGGVGSKEGGAISPSPRLRLLSSASLSMVASAVAFRRYEGPHTPAFWSAVLDAASTRLAAKNDRDFGMGIAASLAYTMTMSSVPAAAFCAAVFDKAAAKPSAFTLHSLSKICWAAAIQGVVSHARLAPVLAHVISLSSAEAKATNSNTRASFDATLLLPAGYDSTTKTKRVQGQFYTALLALSAGGKAPGAAHAVVPEAVVRAWKTALYRATQPSKLHTDVSRVLTAANVAHSCEVTTFDGLIVDILLGSDAAIVDVEGGEGGAPGPGPGPKRLVIEVQGPSHFTLGFDVAKSLVLLARVGDGADGTPVLPLDRLLASYPSDDSIPISLGSDADAAGTALVPTLRTRAKSGWLAAAGFKTIEINFLEWAARASTQEKLELLVEKGVPIDEKYL